MDATSTSNAPYVLQLGKTSLGYTLYDAAAGTYLAINSNDNKLHAGTDATLEAANWNINIDASGNAEILSVIILDGGPLCGAYVRKVKLS